MRNIRKIPACLPSYTKGPIRDIQRQNTRQQAYLYEPTQNHSKTGSSQKLPTKEE